MAEVAWTDQALDDLEAVCRFIGRDSPRFGQLFALRVFEATELLGEFPRLGRIVPEVGRDEVREVIVQGYRIIYQLRGGEHAEILTVHHGARLLESSDLPGAS